MSQFVYVAFSFYHAVATFLKWILEIFIFASVIGKTFALAIFPFFLAVVLVVAFLCMTTVVVDHYAKIVGVALAGVPHIGAGILEHRHDIGYHVTVGVHVLNGVEQSCTLPLPPVEIRFEIPSVARPHCHNVAVKAFAVMAVLVERSNECVVLALIASLEIREIVLDAVAGYRDIYVIALVLLTKR